MRGSDHTPGTKAIYQLTHARMGWFAEKTGKTDGWRFEDITIEWLKKFEHFCGRNTSTNTASRS
ncbi:MAG: phage integrase SAM-like domain-containing protein [Alistipes onderdonkii]